MNIVFFTLAPKFYPSVASYYTNSLNLSYGHTIYLCFCVVFKLFACYLAYTTRLKSPGDQGACFPTVFVTIAAFNCVLSSRETSVNPCKVEWNWLRSLGHSWPRARTESTKSVGSHWQWPCISFLHPNTLRLPPIPSPPTFCSPQKASSFLQKF